MFRDTAKYKFSLPIFSLFIAIISFMLYQAYTGNIIFDYDFIGHAEFARQIERDGLGNVPHPIFHLTILSIVRIIPTLDLLIVSGFVIMMANIIVASTIYVLLSAQFQDSVPQWLIAFLSASLIFITPIYIWRDYSFLVVGYMNPTIYHNPTQNILKMTIIPISLLGFRGLNPKPYNSTKEHIGMVILTFVLMVMMLYSKPSYAIAFLPALGLFGLYRLFKRQPIDWALLVIGIGLPAIFILGTQYLGTYNEGTDSGIGFGFLRVLKLYLPESHLLVQFLASIAFPATVYLLHINTAYKETYLNFSWLIFLFGIFYSYFLFESGQRLSHGNFVWSGYATVFGLMFASVIFLLKKYGPLFENLSENKRTTIPLKFIVVSAVFMLHLIASVTLYLDVVMLS